MEARQMRGLKTNTIVSAEITPSNSPDSQEFTPLVSTAHNSGFQIKEITAGELPPLIRGGFRMMSGMFAT